MTLERWTPFRSLMDIQKEITHLFDDVFSGTEGGRGTDLMRWSPRVDIYEEEGNIVLKAELPGVKKSDIDIEVEDNMLTLRGERRRQEKVVEENYHRTDRQFGAFTRSFTLPKHVDVDKISAHYEDGVLTVTLPKTEEARPKKVAVK